MIVPAYNDGKTIINHPMFDGNHTTYKHGDDWGMVNMGLWHCFNNIRCIVSTIFIRDKKLHIPSRLVAQCVRNRVQLVRAYK